MTSEKVAHLVKHLRRGEKDYFDEFYEITKSGVFYSAYKTLKNRQAAEDVMQDTYISFMENLGRLDDKQNFYYYLLTIAKNKALNVIKKNAKQVFVEDFEYLKTTEDIAFFPFLDYCKERLSSDEWFLIEQCVIIGFKRVEVAKQLGKPIATINWQYNQALKKAKILYLEVERDEKQGGK